MLSISKRERNLWVEGIVDVLVLLYYLPKAWRIIASSSEEALRSSAMAGLIGETIVYAIFMGIVASIAAEILFRKNSEPDISDERDQYFALKSYRLGYYVLIVLAAFLMGQVVLQELFSSLNWVMPLTDSALGFAHWMLLSISLASLLQCGMQLFYYRRGY